MQTTIYTHSAGFEALAGEWDDLLLRSVSAPFFMRYGYQRTWWHYLGNDDLVLITFRNDDGRLVGLASLYGQTNQVGQRELTFVGCVDISDYLDILIDRDYVEPVIQALLDCLADPQRLTWDKLYLCSLPHTSLTPRYLAQAAEARGWSTQVRQQDICPVIALPDSWETYLAGLDKKQRHEIRRKLRKLESEVKVGWSVIDSEAGLPEAMEVFIRLHQQSAQEKQDFWSDKLVQFFKGMALKLARLQWLKLYFIKINETPAAAMLCFDYNNEFLLYNSGYDPQFSALSPGNALTAYTIEQAIKLGRNRYDFLRGDEIYKFRFGGVAEPVYDLEIYHPVRGL